MICIYNEHLRTSHTMRFSTTCFIVGGDAVHVGYDYPCF